MSNWIKIDERSEFISGRVSFIFLGLTQAIMLIAIILQRYVYQRSPAHYNDLAIILGISLIGYWMTSFYLGGVIPELSTMSIIGSYIIYVLSIAVPYTLIRGFPSKDEWIRWVLVIFVGPAVLIGCYAITAALGKKRLDRLTSE
jgi:hypothetical protein